MNKPDALADLRRGETDAIGSVHGLEHVGDQLLQAGMAGLDVLGHLLQHGIAIGANGEDHAVSVPSNSGIGGAKITP